MPSITRSFTVAVSACALALGAGCGDDDDDSGSEPLTRAEYIAQADAICKRVNAEIAKLPQPKSVSDFATLTTVAEDGLQLTDQGIEDLEKLTPPDELADQVDEATEVRKQQREQVVDLQKAAEDKDPEAVEKAVTEASKLDDRGNAIAKQIGLKECGKE